MLRFYNQNVQELLHGTQNCNDHATDQEELMLDDCSGLSIPSEKVYQDFSRGEYNLVFYISKRTSDQSAAHIYKKYHKTDPIQQMYEKHSATKKSCKIW